MHFQILIRDAINVALQWDLSDGAFGTTVMAQAAAMEGLRWD